MEDQIVFCNNLYWPAISQTLHKVPTDLMTSVSTGPRLITTFCKNFEVCVQAGGNVGYYPKIYSEYFKLVYTFEPDPVNFYCLTKNASEKNIIKFQTCISDSHSLVGIEMSQATNEKKGINTGTYTVTTNNQIYPSLKIDDLNLPICNLIHLDIEGFEGYAILGAVETIKRCRPIVCLEINGLGNRHSWPNDRIFQLMMNFNYKLIHQDNSDYIFSYHD